jgi:CrcB protein
MPTETSSPMILLLIALGGAVGSVARYLLGGLVQRTLHPDFPIGTLAVNIIGCALIGVFAKLFLHSQTELPLRATLMVGFCGGFTTFSAFSNETLGLIQGGEWTRAGVYVGLSVIASLGATAAGFALGKSLNP